LVHNINQVKAELKGCNHREKRMKDKKYEELRRMKAELEERKIYEEQEEQRRLSEAIKRSLVEKQKVVPQDESSSERRTLAKIREMMKNRVQLAQHEPDPDTTWDCYDHQNWKRKLKCLDAEIERLQAVIHQENQILRLEPNDGDEQKVNEDKQEPTESKRRLMGTETVASPKTDLTIQSISDPATISFDLTRACLASIFLLLVGLGGFLIHKSRRRCLEAKNHPKESVAAAESGPGLV